MATHKLWGLSKKQKAKEKEDKSNLAFESLEEYKARGGSVKKFEIKKDEMPKLRIKSKDKGL